eukprot:Skav216355  [mRNA]  locus=scaffold2385:238985:241160:- [translate_table: standard]
MSDHALLVLASAITQLAEAIRGITCARRRVASPSPDPPRAISPASSPDPNLEDYYSWVDSDLPAELLALGRQRLSDKPPGVRSRCESAFFAGQKARAAIDSDSVYSPRAKASGAKNRVWVVLRSTLADPFQASSLDTVHSVVGRAADPLLILEAFDSLTEVEIYCAGEDEHLLVLTPPEEYIAAGKMPSCLAFPVLPRQGGMLLAIPLGYLSEEAVDDATQSPEEGSLLGPAKDFEANLIEEDDDGAEVYVGSTETFLVIDMADRILSFLREYDPVVDPSGENEPYSLLNPPAIVKVAEIMPGVQTWIENLAAAPRLNFYSAREEPEAAKAAPKRAAPKRVTTALLAQKVDTLTEQLQALATSHQALLAEKSSASATPVPVQSKGVPMQATLPALSAGLGQPPTADVRKAAAIVGPPPRAKPPAAVEPPSQAELLSGLGASGVFVDPAAMDPQVNVSHALLQQSSAITALVTQLASDGFDLSASSSASPSVLSRGVAKREKMQRELAERSSNYFMQVQQQMFRRMNPGKPVPRNETELAASPPSMATYLERNGGFKNNRDAALVMWMLAHAVDAASAGDFHQTKEYLALMSASMEQSVLDGGWSVAYLLSLLDEPPVQLYADRPIALSSLGRPFAGLVPQQWASTSLAYLKEIEVLQTKKQDTKTAPKATSPADPGGPPSPKRRPKFPKKPKAGGEASPSSST